MIDGLPPGLILALGGILLAFTTGMARNVLAVALPAITLLMVVTVPDGVSSSIQFLEYKLVLLKGDAVSRMFGTIFGIFALAGGIFALKAESKWELSAAYVYAGSAICAVFAGDLLTIFVFWEIMAIGSGIVIWSASTEASRAASVRYLGIHLAGGVIFMAGLVGIVAKNGTVDMYPMTASDPSSWLLLAGILINAAAPPLWSWVADAYPSASPTGTVFLSAFTTKTAVYVLWRLYPGQDILVWLGLAMAVYGVIYAFLSSDIRKILVYALVNQVGFLVAAIGMGTEITLNGAVAHSFAHILYKGLLLMTAGVIIHATGKRHIEDLGGLFKKLPWTGTFAIIALLTGAAMPGTAAYATKSFITSGAAEAGLTLPYTVLTIASAGLVTASLLKYVWFAFFGEDKGLEVAHVPMNMKIGMAIVATLCIFFGLFPSAITDHVPYNTGFTAMKGYKIVTQIQVIAFAAAAFFAFRQYIFSKRSEILDFDWFYRVGFKWVAIEIAHVVGKFGLHIKTRSLHNIEHAIQRLYNHVGPDGAAARSWPSGAAAMAVAVVLLVYLVVYYLA